MKSDSMIRKAAAWLLRPVSDNAVFAFFIGGLALLTLLIEVVGLNWKFPRFNLFSIVLDVYLLCVLLSVLPRKARRWGRGIVAVVLYALAVIDAFCVHYFSATIGPEILNVCVETTGRESAEFADKYITPAVLLTGVGAVLLWGMLHVGVAFLERRWRLGGWPDRLRAAATLMLVAAVAVSMVIAVPSRINLIQMLMVDTVADFDRHISNQTLNTPLNNLLFSIKTRRLANEGLRELTHFQHTVSVDSCSHTLPNIVLVIGESYIKRHSQLYGYGKPTTPLQWQRATDSTLTVFSDVVTPSNLTSTVFKHVFSLHSAADSADWSHYPLFTVLYRKAGYRVSFLTNQFVKTVTQDAFNISGGLFLNDTELSSLQFDERNQQSHRYDMEMLADYHPADTQPDVPRLSIFHLAGQHIDFFKRCPDSLRFFTAKDYSHRADLDESERQLVADYDNATRYNDMVVDSIVRMFREKDAVVIYFSDHGEECFDELHRMGRLPQKGFESPEAIRSEYEIPFWIWCSAACRNRHPSLYRQIREAASRPFMIDDLPHTLLALAGIHTPYYQPQRDLLSPVYDVHRHRLLGGTFDYDAARMRW